MRHKESEAVGNPIAAQKLTAPNTIRCRPTGILNCSRFLPVLLVAGIVFFSTIGFAQQKQKQATPSRTVELATLVSTLAWGTDSSLSVLPISWRNAVPRGTSGMQDRADIYAYRKQGEAIVSVDGKLLKDRDGDVVSWEVGTGLVGAGARQDEPRTALILLGIYNSVPDLFGKYLGRPALLRDLKMDKVLKPAGIRCVLAKCKRDRATGGFKIYSIEKDGFSPAWLQYGWDGGSGGDSVEFVVLHS